MAYSGDPSASALDQVRFILGDTDPKSELLTDGEIAFLLAQSKGNANRAAIAGCYSILAKLSPIVDERVGDVSVSISQRRSNYEALLQSLQSQSAQSGTLRYRAYAGGTSWADKWALASDPDRVQPQFRRSYSTAFGSRRFTGPRGVPVPFDDGTF